MTVRIWEFFCTHVTHVIVVIFCTTDFVSPKSIFSQYRFPFPLLRFLGQNHVALLKDRFLKKMLWKRAITYHLFFTKLKAQIILSNKLKTISDFQDSEVWIQGNSSIWPMAKCIQLWPLNSTSMVNVRMTDLIQWATSILHSAWKFLSMQWIRHTIATESCFCMLLCCSVPEFHWFCNAISSILVQDRWSIIW